MDDTSLKLTPQEQCYLNSPSFENYMIAGVLFVLGMTLSFILTIVAHVEPLFWPGITLSIIISFIVLHKLKKREYRMKLRELQEKYKS